MQHKIIKLGLVAASLSFSLIAQSDRVPAGTEISVRTNDAIDARYPSDSRIYTGTVDRDVLDRDGHAIVPRGAQAELILRDASSRDVVLDLESVVVSGHRYAVQGTPESVSTRRKEGVGANERTGRYVGGGAIVGSIIGAIAGGGKGAAIGAAAGAGAGAAGQTATRGQTFRIPPETLLTFRLDQPLFVDRADQGYDRDGHHYHRYDNPDERLDYRDRGPDR
jgi:hypothetical protein